VRPSRPEAHGGGAAWPHAALDPPALAIGEQIWWVPVVTTAEARNRGRRGAASLDTQAPSGPSHATSVLAAAPTPLGPRLTPVDLVAAKVEVRRRRGT
jgi:hypothetical protein